MTVSITEGVALAPLTTLGIGGAARRFAKVETVAQVSEALAAAGDDPVLILGGGSNLVVRDGGWPGLAIQLAIPGVAIDDDGDHARVTVMAGVVWDDFVAQMVDAKLSGVECLSGIPGLAGATPMQNVGAYGQEVSDTIERVRVLDRETGALETFSPAGCGFAYRTSVFKGSERWIVVEVTFRLRKADESQPIRYAELSKALGIGDGERAPLRTVRDTVIRLRRGKGMVVDAQDPDSRSAGSFFTNPIIGAAQLADVQTRVPPNMPSWPNADGTTKLSAGWLIERAGFAKGTVRGNAGISTKHALALVNRGGASARELLALAAEIQAGVKAKFGVDLVPEPVIVGKE